MKRFTLIIASLALLIGFSHCKKDNDTPNTNDNRIQITLNANYGGNGSKTTFDPVHGTFAWAESTTEYINVGGKVSGYLGQLSNEGDKGTGNFSGNITTPDAGETMLYFFYLGNGNHEGASTVDFSSQDGTLANVTNCHIAIGSEEYTGQTSFTATLNMAMAIAYFDLSQFTSDSKAAETVYLNGNHIYSTASVNYNDGTITGNSKGQIKLGTANNGMYVALIPSVETETTLNFNSSSKTGSMTFNNGIKPASFYSNSGGALLVEATAGSGIPGTFSVSADKKVFFSKGNLQYQASTNTWRFAENQYDYVGDATCGNVYENEVKCNNSLIAENYSGWIDLFGWGTSGWNNGNTNYQPYNHYYTSPSYGFGYGPKQGYLYNFDLTGDYANADWGVYNNISNGGTGWRTLTGFDDSNEWNYLLKTRSASSINGVENARYVRATVNGVNGLVLFPDIYTHPDGVSLPTNASINSSDGWETNVYNGDNWIKMENAGAVFLPVTGKRNVEQTTINDVDKGYYWSVNYYTNGTKFYACSVVFQSKNLEAYNRSQYRYYGLAVRLVKDVQ